MYRSYLTDADIAATLWPDIFEGMIDPSITAAAQDVHEDSITGYPSDSSTADTDLPNFNADSDTAFTPTPSTSSMETFTTQSDYSYLVSKQRFDSSTSNLRCRALP